MCHPPRGPQEIDPSIKSPESILPRPVPFPHPLSSHASTRRQFRKVDAKNNPSSPCTSPSDSSRTPLVPVVNSAFPRRAEEPDDNHVLQQSRSMGKSGLMEAPSCEPAHIISDPRLNWRRWPRPSTKSLLPLTRPVRWSKIARIYSHRAHCLIYGRP